VRSNSFWKTAVGLAAVILVTSLLARLSVSSAATVALSYLLIVLFVAASAPLVSAVVVSIAATLALNFFFMPPIGTLTIADPHNWIALVAFLTVAIVASQLSTSARSRAREALDRRNELTRLFDLTRDILLTTEREGAIRATARHIARRFELTQVTICLPSPEHGWDLHGGGEDQPEIPSGELDRALAAARGALEFDARTRTYGGHRQITTPGGTPLQLVPIRLGVKATGLLAVGGRDLEPGTLDAIAGIAAIAVERSQFLEERRQAELTTQRAELSSALLASLGHDLRTPLTAVRVALSNTLDPALPDDQRKEQASLALGELDRLNRLFQEILDMARIETRTVQPEPRWASPSEIVEAAMAHAGPILSPHTVRVDADSGTLVELDPRLTAVALAHLLENAAQYAPSDSAIEVQGWVDTEGLRFTVTDHGPGLDAAEMERLFEPFFRGTAARQTAGTGMGLSITRGLLTALDGRVWAENIAPHGARFSIAVPGRQRALAKTAVSS